MQQQYQLSFSMPLAPAPKQHQEDLLKLPEDLALLQTVDPLSRLWFVFRCSY